MVYVSSLKAVQEVTVWVTIWQAQSSVALQINEVWEGRVAASLLMLLLLVVSYWLSPL
jgi:hypothetical protein